MVVSLETNTSDLFAMDFSTVYKGEYTQTQAVREIKSNNLALHNIGKKRSISSSADFEMLGLLLLF